MNFKYAAVLLVLIAGAVLAATFLSPTQEPTPVVTQKTLSQVLPPVSEVKTPVAPEVAVVPEPVIPVTPPPTAAAPEVALPKVAEVVEKKSAPVAPAVEKKAPAVAKNKPAPKAKNKGPAVPKPVEPETLPIARAALSLVGFDAAAEAYWHEAINDPSYSKSAREDLIEDLNEEGFVDPKHPTVEDLPLIVNRLELIEQLAPYSMDEVNYAAFAEAYKDLQNMLGKVIGK